MNTQTTLTCLCAALCGVIVAPAKVTAEEVPEKRLLGYEWRRVVMSRYPVVIETNVTGGRLEILCDLVEEKTRIAWRGPEDRGNALNRLILVPSDEPQKDLWTFWTKDYAYNFTFSSDGTNTVMAFLKGCWLIFIPRFRVTPWDVAFEKLRKHPYGQHLPEDQRPCEAVNIFEYFNSDFFDDTVAAIRHNIWLRRLWWDGRWRVELEGDEGKRYRLWREEGRWRPGLGPQVEKKGTLRP